MSRKKSDTPPLLYRFYCTSLTSMGILIKIHQKVTKTVNCQGPTIKLQTEWLTNSCQWYWLYMYFTRFHRKWTSNSMSLAKDTCLFQKGKWWIWDQKVYLVKCCCISLCIPTQIWKKIKRWSRIKLKRNRYKYKIQKNKLK